MTHTIQILSPAVIENTGKTTAEENITNDHILDVHIREILSICDSLNKLCERLNRLEYVLKRKNIEINLLNKL